VTGVQTCALPISFAVRKHVTRKKYAHVNLQTIQIYVVVLDLFEFSS